MRSIMSKDIARAATAWAILGFTAIALAQGGKQNGDVEKHDLAPDLLAPPGPLGNPLLDAQLRAQNPPPAPELRPVAELVFSADLATILPGEMISLARYFDSPGYLVMQRGPNLIIEESAGLVWLGKRMNERVQEGAIETTPDENLGVLWNSSSKPAQVRVGDMEGRLIEIRAMGMVAVGNMVFEDGTAWSTPRGSNSCVTVCDGINDGACCNYQPNGEPTCTCEPNGDIKPGDCAVGGQRSTGCSITQN
jgi:hypothetical protein